MRITPVVFRCPICQGTIETKEWTRDCCGRQMVRAIQGIWSR